MRLKLSEHPLTQDFLERNIPLWQSIQFESLTGDASNRRYIRVHNKNESYVLVIYPTPSSPHSKSSILNFLDIQKLFQNYEIKVPQIIASDLNLGCILLEDLGNITLEHQCIKTLRSKESQKFYLKTIDELIKIHKIPIDSTQKTSCFHEQFSKEKLLWELDYMKTHLLDQYLKIRLSNSEKDSLETEFHSVCEALSSLPQVVCHRDYHSRNIMIHQNQTYIIDFQDARLGPRQYDLVSLFQDSYINIPEDLEKKWLQHYMEYAGLEETTSFMTSYKIQIIQRGLKACGSFTSFYNQKNETRYLNYLKPTLKKIKKIVEELKNYPSLEKLFTDHLENYIK